KEKFANTTFLHHDVRNMKIFEDDTFDFVLFSYNGLDSMGNNNRLKTLKEIHRILKKDGVFVFSSHNRNYRLENSFPRMSFAPCPYVQAKLFAKIF
uniref:class I SAM-dependent methyltransferase n=1 Tax=Kuenenia stuttgartiensis TaxID=174633 RepID=UPI00146F81A2